jgi:hypothetical protein
MSFLMTFFKEEELTLDLSLRLKPTDITIDESGEMTIEDEILRYIEASTAVSTARANTALWQSKEAILTQDTYSSGDMTSLFALWDTNDLESKIGISAKQFALMSAEARQAFFEK